MAFGLESRGLPGRRGLDHDAWEDFGGGQRAAADDAGSSVLLGLFPRGSSDVRLQQQRDQAGPAGLVRGAEAAPRVAVEVFIEQDVVAEGRVLLLQPVGAEDRTAAIRPAQE